MHNAVAGRWLLYTTLALTVIALPSEVSAGTKKIKGDTDLSDYVTNGIFSDDFKFEKDNKTLFIDGGVNDVTLSGVIHVKAGKTGNTIEAESNFDGTVSLSADNSYDQNITLRGGIIEVIGSGRLGSGNFSGAMDLGSGGNTGTFKQNSSSAQTFSGTISGTGSLIKNNTGTLTLSGSNTYTGATTIDGGILEAQGGSAIGDASAVTVNSGGTFEVDNNETIGRIGGAGNTTLNATLTTGDATDTNISGNISGTGGLTKQGASTMELTGSNTYTGTTTVNAGTLRMVNSSAGDAIFAASDAQQSYVVNSGATLEFSRSSDEGTKTIKKFNLSGTGTFKKSGDSELRAFSDSTVAMGSGALFHVESGIFTVGGNNNAADWSGNLSDLQVDSGATIDGTGSSMRVNALDGAGSVLSNGGLTVGVGNGGGSFSGVIADSSLGMTNTYSLTKEGSGTQTLSGANTYSGDTTISGGTLEISGAGSLGSGTYAGAIANSGTFKQNSTADQTLSGVISGSGSLVKDNSGTLTLSGANTYTGDTTISSGTLEISGTGSLGSGTYAGAIANSGTFKQNSTADQTLSGVISGTGALVKDNTGTLTLTGDNTYSGGTTLNAGAGTLVITGVTSAGTGAIVQTDANSILRFDTTGTIANNMTLYNFESLRNVTLSGDINSQDATYKIATGKDTILSGNITGTGKLSQIGADDANYRGTLTLSGDNDFDGDTEVDSVLNVGSSGALSENSKLKVNNGGMVKLNGFDSTVAGLEGSGTIQGSAALTVGDENDAIFSGILQDGDEAGGLSLTKTGTGKMTLSGANTFSGNTTLDDGSLEVKNAQALGTGSLSQTDGSSSLIFDTTGTVTNDLSIFSVEFLQDVILSGNIIANNATYNVADGVTSEASGDITGTGGTTKLGLGTQVLSGNNTYTGANDVQAGTLRAGSTTAFGDNVATTVDSGAVLELDGFSNSIGSLAGAGTVENASATAATLTTGADNTSTTFSGVLQDGTGGGALSLTKTGSGTQTLSGVNTYTGNTTISAGTLEIGGAGQLGSGSYAGAISNSGSLNYNSSANQTLSGVISGSGALVKDNSSVLTLSGTNTYTGATAINAGTLEVSGSSDTASYTIASGATLNLNNATQTSPIFNGDGTLAIDGGNFTTLNFGDDTTGLSSGTVTLSNTVNAYNLKFGKESGDITLTGGNISMAAGGTSVIQAYSGSGSVSNTHTINSNISKASGSLRFGTQSTANEKYVMNGVLSGGFALDGRVVNGSGQLYLNGLNTFTSNVSLVTGQYYVNTLADSGVASSFGAGSSISLGGGGGQNPRLIYTGSTATSTNRTVTINANGVVGVIAQDGAVDLSGTVRANSGATTYNLYLSGAADTGTNEVSGVMQDNGSGKLAVRVNSTGATGVSGEAGYWVFSGANTYTGSTLIQNSSTLVLGNGGSTGSLATGSAITVDGGSSFIVNQSDTVAQGTDFSDSLSGGGDVIMNGSGRLDLKIKGSGWTGDTIVNSGTLRLANTADLAGMTSDNFYINNGSTLEIESSVGGANRSTLLNDSIFTFDSNGGGNIDFVSGNHLAQTGSSGNARFVTTGGAQNTITTQGGYINPQGSGNHMRFVVADGTDDVDLSVAVTMTNGTWRKDGAGTLSIIGSGSAAGGAININEGTFEIGGNGQIRSTSQASGSGIFSNAINNEGVFKHNTTQNQTVSGVIGGTGAVEKDNTGTLTLSGANTFTGNVLVSGGTLATSGSGGGRLGANSTGRTVTVNGATSVLDVASTNAFVANHSTENDITLVAQNGGTISNSGGALNRIGDVTLNGGTLEANVDSVNWGSWYFGTRNGGQDATVTVSGSTASTISGAGNIALGANTQFNVADATGDAATDLTVSAILATGSSSGHTGGFTKSGAGTMELTGVNTYTGDTTISAGTVEIGSAGQLGSGTYAGAIANSGTFNYNSSADQTLSGVMSGTGAVEMNGSGTLTLTANNTFSGGTTVNSGTITLTDAGRIGGGGLTVNNGGTFSIANDDFNSLGGVITVNEGGTLSTDSTGNNAHNIAGITLNGGTLSSSGNSYSEGNWIFNGDVTVGGSALSTISGLAVGSKSGGGTYNVADSVAGSGTDLLVTANMVDASGGSFLTKTGAGTMELTGVNTYSGDTTISAGTLEIGGAGQLGSGTYAGAIANSGTFNYNSSADQTLSGVMSGAGAVEMNGSGTLTLSGTVANTYSGGTTINAGTVSLGTGGGVTSHQDALGTGAVTVNSSGELRLWIENSGSYAIDNVFTLDGGRVYAEDGIYDLSSAMTLNAGGGTLGAKWNGKTLTVSGVISGSGALTIDEEPGGTGGTVILAGVNAYTGDTNISAGTLQIDGAGQLGSGSYAGTIANSGTFNYNSSADQTLSGVMSGTGSLTTNGAGTLTLSAANTYTGATTVNAGTLKVTTQTGLGTTAGATTVADGATLELDYVPADNASPIEENITLNGAGVGGTEGALKITGTGPGSELNSTITLGSNTTINTQARFDMGGTITDNGNDYTLTKTGSNYNNFLSYGGTANFSHLNIAEGDFWANSSTALPGGVGSTVNVANGAQLTIWDSQAIVNAPNIFFAGGSTFRTDRGGSYDSSIDGTMTLNGDTIFAINRSDSTTTINSIISGSGKLNKKGEGTMILAGNNTMSGNFQMGSNTAGDTGGTVVLMNSGALGTKFVQFENDGSLELGADGLTIANNIAVYNRNDSATVWRTLRLDLAGDTSGEFGGYIDIRKNNRFRADVGDGDTLTLSGNIRSGAGAGGISKIGNGTLELTGSNTFKGALTVDGGKVVLSNTTNTFTNKIDINAGEVQLAGSGRLNDQAIEIASGATFRWSSSALADSGNGYYDGAITGDGTFIKDGSSSELLVRGANSIATIEINQGQLTGGSSASSLGTGSTTIYLGDTSGSNSATMSYGGALSGTMTAKADIIVRAGSSGTKTYGKSVGGDITDNTTITLNDDLNVNPGTSGTLTLGGVISGSGGLAKTNTGTLELTGDNTYTGATTVSAGTLALNNTTTSNTTIAGDGTIGTFDVTISGGTLRNDADEQIANNASITMSSGAYSLNGTTETIDGFTNSGGTFTTGAGTLTGLGNTITWSGGTNTINDGGTVQDTHFDVSGGTNTVEGGTTGGTLHVQSGGIGFEFTGTGTPNVTLNSDATNAGRMLLEGNLTVASTITGTATISNGGAAANSGFIDMNGGTRTFTVNDATPDIDLEISALLTNGGLTKEGTGTMRLTGDNTYDGVTDINAGTLLINASNAGAIGDVNINSGGTLGGTGTVGGATTLNSGGFLSPGDGGTGDTLSFLSSLDITDASAGSLLFDLGAAGSGDTIDVTGQLSIGDGLLDLDNFAFTDLGVTSVTGTYTWNLFEVGSFDFTNLGSNTTSTPFASIKSASLAISGDFIQLTMTVPEPSSVALLSLGGLALMLRRKRQG